MKWQRCFWDGGQTIPLLSLVGIQRRRPSSSNEPLSRPVHAPRLCVTAVHTATHSRMAFRTPHMAAQNHELEHPPAMARPRVVPAEEDLERLAGLLNTACSVTLFGGSGCEGAHNEVVALAGQLRAPVGFAFRGKQFLEYENPYEVGMTGLLGYSGAHGAVHDCDLLLLLGTDFPYDQFMPTDITVAQLDLRGKRLGGRSRLDLGLCGDVKETIRALLPRLDAKETRVI